MARIVCQVTVNPDQLTFTWSDAPASFPPFHVTGQGLLDFRDTARERLRDLVKDHQDKGEEDRAADQREWPQHIQRALTELHSAL
jgi:hypothetical protein